MNPLRSFAGLLFVFLLSTTRICASGFPADGVYFSFEAFRAAIPDLEKNELHRELDKDNFTIRQWIAAAKRFYISETGRTMEVGSDSIWGYAESGVVYVQLGKRFHKISTLGSISYFLESYPVVGGNPGPVITETKGAAAYRLLDMDTGEFYYYTPEDLGILLEKDEALYREYEAIESLKTKKKKMFLFLERFNKAHPLQAAGS